MWHMEFVQEETLSFRFMRFSFAQLHQSMHGQWQRCYGSALLRYLFILHELLCFALNKCFLILNIPRFSSICSEGSIL